MSSRKKPDEDERFRRVQKDPRFWEMPEKEHKVKIDKRFQSMFHDQRFKVKQTVDKRGRPVSHSTAEDLKRFYQLTSQQNQQSSHQEDQSIWNYGVCSFISRIPQTELQIPLINGFLTSLQEPQPDPGGGGPGTGSTL
uniref:ESF1, nucleolar pre-rRNA processing protein, homolog (S. cerevisiae) n=1 Tax=Fundulus heteroclitus TaxID=8078 RepID=A0A3Q2PJJ6_FUNHE